MAVGDDIDRLREELARHSGLARMRPLMALGQALGGRYWRVGIGSAAGRPLLDEAIECLTEAHRYLPGGELLRGRAAAMLGTLVGQRHIVYFGSEDDQASGIALLDEALGFPQLPPMQLVLGRLILGHLSLLRSLRRIREPGLMLQVVLTGPTDQERSDLDRAVACLDRVIADPAAGPGVVRIARTMRDSADAVRGLMAGLGGGPSGLATALSTVGTTVQKLNEMASVGASGSGYGFLPNPFDLGAGERIAQAAPADRPVFTFFGPTPTTGKTPAPPPAPVAPAPATVLREAFFERLAGGSGFDSVRAALGNPTITAGAVDDLAALAGQLVEAPGKVVADRLLLATALYLRARLDAQKTGSGWESADDGPTDADMAADELSNAGPALLSEPADATLLAHRLASLLDEFGPPSPDAGDRLDETLGPAAAALRDVGADALLYSSPDTSALLDAASGRLTSVEPGDPPPSRLIVVGDPPTRPPATPTSVVSFVGSGRQLIQLAARARRPLTEGAVFVANPRRDRQPASIDAMVLRRTFHPRSQGLGETIEDIDGIGTAAEVSNRLDAALLHLGCGVTVDGGLELAGGDVLGPDAIAADPPSTRGGVAILTTVGAGTASLTEALLASRFRDVIAIAGELPDDVASVIFFLLHRALVDDELDPAHAVAHVHRWLADPDRIPPDDLPIWYSKAWLRPDLGTWSAGDVLIHHGA